eukprot:792487-Pyramimonas_sp.AAC.1
MRRDSASAAPSATLSLRAISAPLRGALADRLLDDVQRAMPVGARREVARPCNAVAAGVRHLRP